MARFLQQPFMILAVGLILLGVTSGAEAESLSLNNLQQWQGGQSQQITPTTSIINDSAGWQNLWARIGKPQPQPEVSEHTPVAVFAGRKPTSGYQVKFTEVDYETDQTLVRYKISAPRFDEMVSQVITAPYAVLMVPNRDVPIVIQEQP
jgi:hypothetical protein